jgi:transcriptional regulator with XRE-family HTH domain
MAKKTKKSNFETAVVDNVRRERNKRNVTQPALALLLEVTDGYIGQIESHKSPSKYTLDQLNKIALDFGCSPKDFMPDLGVIEPEDQKD